MQNDGDCDNVPLPPALPLQLPIKPKPSPKELAPLAESPDVLATPTAVPGPSIVRHGLIADVLPASSYKVSIVVVYDVRADDEQPSCCVVYLSSCAVPRRSC